MKTFGERVLLAVPDVPAEHRGTTVLGLVFLTMQILRLLHPQKKRVRSDARRDGLMGGAGLRI